MSRYDAVVKMWQDWNIQSIDDLALRLDNFRILFAYNSGKIENAEINYHDTREIFENGKVVGYTGSTRTLFEQQNQKVCYDFLQDKIIAKEPLSIGLICAVHRALTEGTYDERRYIVNGERPGEFKKHDYVTGKNEVGSQPVADGNGRVGRTLLNYWLMINNYPPTIVYEEDRRAYYDALQDYDEQEDLTPLVQFLEAQTVKTWSRSTEGKKPTPHKKLNSFCCDA